MYKVTLTALAAALLLTACGGSDKATSNTTAKPKVDTNSKHTEPKGQANMGNALVILDGTRNEYERRLHQHGVRVNSLNMTIDGKSYPNAKGVNLKVFGLGFKSLPYAETIKATDLSSGRQVTLQGRGMIHLFQQKYSVIAAFDEHEWVETVDGQRPKVDRSGDVDIFLAGQATKTLPTAGIYNYHGQSHIHHDDRGGFTAGRFNYTIDFAQRHGHGRIEGNDGHIITLSSSKIDRYRVTNPDGTFVDGFGVRDGIARSNREREQGEYQLGIFGNHAEEVIGHIEIGDYEGAIGGTKK